MSNTTRLANQDIVNIAKQQYENKQRSKLPSIIVNLPSNGLIYPESSPLRDGKVEIRYMTAYDEDILTNSSYIQSGIVFDKLLESIILSPISVNDIAPADRDALIIYSRIVSYGSEYPVSVQDPKTKNQLNRIVDLTKLSNKPFNLTPDANGEFEYEFGSNKIKFVYNVRVKENMSVSDIMKLIIVEINGSRKQSDIESFIRYEFLARDAKQFRTFFAQNTPGIDYNYEFEGEDGSTFIATFLIAGDLFWF